MRKKQTENMSPYPLFSDIPGGNVRGRDWKVGSYTITDTVNEEADLNGEIFDSLTVDFSVIDCEHGRLVM
jgi:hypothetical protein